MSNNCSFKNGKDGGVNFLPSFLINGVKPRLIGVKPQFPPYVAECRVPLAYELSGVNLSEGQSTLAPLVKGYPQFRIIGYGL